LRPLYPGKTLDSIKTISTACAAIRTRQHGRHSDHENRPTITRFGARALQTGGGSGVVRETSVFANAGNSGPVRRRKLAAAFANLFSMLTSRFVTVRAAISILRVHADG
jgi:hypothetical protein